MTFTETTRSMQFLLFSLLLAYCNGKYERVSGIICSLVFLHTIFFFSLLVHWESALRCEDILWMQHIPFLIYSDSLAYNGICCNVDPQWDVAINAKKKKKHILRMRNAFACIFENSNSLTLLFKNVRNHSVIYFGVWQ